jgi:hypothetical protein
MAAAIDRVIRSLDPPAGQGQIRVISFSGNPAAVAVLPVERFNRSRAKTKPRKAPNLIILLPDLLMKSSVEGYFFLQPEVEESLLR